MQFLNYINLQISGEETVVEASEGRALAGLQKGVEVRFSDSAEDAFDGAEVFGVRHQRGQHVEWMHERNFRIHSQHFIYRASGETLLKQMGHS